jgi:hypothetical protein
MAHNLNIPAIRNGELQRLLSFYGLKEGLVSGRLVCASCETKLSDENIGVLLVHKGSLILYCMSLDCIEDAVEASAKLERS